MSIFKSKVTNKLIFNNIFTEDRIDIKNFKKKSY